MRRKRACRFRLDSACCSLAPSFVAWVSKLSSVIGDAHRGLQQLSVLQHLLDSITSASIRITDIVINTVTNTYGVGIALDVTTSNPPLPSLFGVTLVSLGFNVTKVAKQKPAADEPPMSPDAPKP